MELEHVDRLLEAVFDEESPEEGGIGPAPNRMKKFFPPEPVRTPTGTAGRADDLEGLWRAVENHYRTEWLERYGTLGDWEQNKERVKGMFLDSPEAQAKARERVEGAQPVAPSAGGLEDREGQYSMRDMLPKDQTATSDDLVDFYSRASREQDPARQAAMMKEFGAHKAEFEARLHRFVDALIEG